MILMFWYLDGIAASFHGGVMGAATRCTMRPHGGIALSLHIWYT
jgi:hypothetical protein